MSRNSIVTVTRQSDGKFLRYETSDAEVIARMEQGKLKVTSKGMELGYYLHPVTGKLTHLGTPVLAPSSRR